MKTLGSHGRRLGIFSLAVAALSGVALAQQPEDDVRYLFYLPSTDPRVDHDGIVQAFGDHGFNVSTHADAGERRADYAKRIAGEIRALLDRGVDPYDITVVGADSGSDIAVLASAVTGNRHVNYVLLGQCDIQVKRGHQARMSGRVLGMRDRGDPGAQSCRPLWSGDPKVSERRDLVLDTGYGEALFHRARVEWTKPLTEWSSGGRVDVGEVQITSLEPRGAQRVN